MLRDNLIVAVVIPIFAVGVGLLVIGAIRGNQREMVGRADSWRTAPVRPWFVWGFVLVAFALAALMVVFVKL
jgi:uncharacterized membrane protein YadS